MNERRPSLFTTLRAAGILTAAVAFTGAMAEAPEAAKAAVSQANPTATPRVIRYELIQLPDGTLVYQPIGGGDINIEVTQSQCTIVSNGTVETSNCSTNSTDNTENINGNQNSNDNESFDNTGDNEDLDNSNNNNNDNRGDNDGDNHYGDNDGDNH